MSKARDANDILREEGRDGLRRHVDNNRRPYVGSAAREAEAIRATDSAARAPSIVQRIHGRRYRSLTRRQHCLSFVLRVVVSRR